jgi:hypothetical protein
MQPSPCHPCRGGNDVRCRGRGGSSPTVLESGKETANAPQSRQRVESEHGAGQGEQNGCRLPSGRRESNDLRIKPDQLQLNSGDVVTVEENKILPFYVTGSVNKPGEFPTPQDREIHLLEGIGLAGGVNSLSQPNQALVIRRIEGKEPLVLRVNLDRAAKVPKENIRLMSNDVVNIQEDFPSQTRRFFREFVKAGISANTP